MLLPQRVVNPKSEVRNGAVENHVAFSFRPALPWAWPGPRKSTGKEKEGFPGYGKLNRALHNVGPGRVAPFWAQRGPQRGLGKIGAPRSRLGPYFTAALENIFEI